MLRNFKAKKKDVGKTLSELKIEFKNKKLKFQQTEEGMKSSGATNATKIERKNFFAAIFFQNIPREYFINY